MEDIIQQIVNDFTTKIMKRFNPEEIRNIGELANHLLDDSKDFAKQFFEVFIAEINREIREDKAARKQTGLVLQEKNRKRSLYTSLGKGKALLRYSYQAWLWEFCLHRRFIYKAFMYIT